MDFELPCQSFHQTFDKNSTETDKNKRRIAADIIGYIRRYALGSPLISHEERIGRVVEKLRKNHNFTKMELDWLRRFEKTLLAETIIDREILDSGSYRSQGGFERINRQFSGKLETYLRELNEYLYEDEEKTAS